jgi:hypothetical protein
MLENYFDDHEYPVNDSLSMMWSVTFSEYSFPHKKLWYLIEIGIDASYFQNFSSPVSFLPPAG